MIVQAVRLHYTGQALSHELAQQLGLTPASAQTYIKRLYRKLGVAGHKDLVAWLLKDVPL